MKKFFLIFIIGILVLSGLGAGAIKSNGIKPVFETNYNQEPLNDPLAYTHTVLVEVGTATWCPSCPASNSAWHTIYESGNYDFEYTELVYDKNAKASQRFSEFNPKYVPTSYWDGGQYTYPGTSTGTFYSYLGLSGSRTVPDLVASLDVAWLGSAKMEITYSVLNNEATSYPGKLRIYVVEFVSTLWNDYNGNPYNHAFLDFAVNQVINIPAGDTLSNTVTWNGATAGYPNVKQDNLQVILAVFGNTPHQSYSDPPSGNPFSAYYSDECIAAVPGSSNNPPAAPTISGPKKVKVNISTDYSFSSVDPDSDNIAQFIINWGDGSGDQTVNGPFQSGQTVKASHTWTSEGTYTITAKAKDSKGAIGSTKTLSISTPRQRAVYTPFYNFLENHPNLFLILKIMLNKLK
jgi:thiol-disulfide isomerase/thioredoxin